MSQYGSGGGAANLASLASIRPPPHASLLDDAFAPASFLQREAHLLNETVSLRRVRTYDGRASSSFFVPNLNSLDWVLNEVGEKFVRHVFGRVLLNGMMCTASASKSRKGRGGMVLDVGANEGYYGLLSGHWGCRVVLFEPQPGCIALIQAALLLNGLGKDMARLIPRPVSSTYMELPVLQTPVCYGGFSGADNSHYSLKRLPRHHGKPPTSHTRTIPQNITTVGSVRFEDVFSAADEFALVKIDVEGAEIDILTALMPFIRRHQVHNLVVEMTPGWWSKSATDQAKLVLEEMERYNLTAFTQSQFTQSQYEQSAPMRSIRVSNLIGFIKSRRPRPQENVWFRLPTRML